MNKGEKAASLFRDGYNCAQAAILAFADESGLDEKTLCRLASSFGGGMGRMREVCGSVSGMLMILGLIKGYDSPSDRDGKAETYRVVQELAEAFKEVHGSIVCREILKKPNGKDHYQPAERTKQYYDERPCEHCVKTAANILENFLKN